MDGRIPNHKERRQMEKDAGLLKQKKHMSREELAEYRRRKLEMGKEIHRQNVERNLRRQEEAKEQRESQKLQERVEDLIKKGKTAEEAQLIAISEREKRMNGQ